MAAAYRGAAGASPDNPHQPTRPLKLCGWVMDLGTPQAACLSAETPGLGRRRTIRFQDCHVPLEHVRPAALINADDAAWEGPSLDRETCIVVYVII